MKTKLPKIIAIGVLTTGSFVLGSCATGYSMENIPKTQTSITTSKQMIADIISLPLAKETKTNEVVEKKYITGWTTTSVNVRKTPSTDSHILKTYLLNKKVEYVKYNEKWVEIKYNKTKAYICKDYISNKKLNYVEYDVPKTTGFKSYMAYQCITSPSSPQYTLQKNRAYTGKYGIRQVDGRYCVAIGSHFTTKIGTLFDLILENGTIIPCILADQKADEDTDSNNIVTNHNGCMSEFIIDLTSLKHSAKRDGDISSCTKKWNSPVKTIRIYKYSKKWRNS